MLTSLAVRPRPISREHIPYREVSATNLMFSLRSSILQDRPLYTLRTLAELDTPRTPTVYRFIQSSFRVARADSAASNSKSSSRIAADPPVLELRLTRTAMYT